MIAAKKTAFSVTLPVLIAGIAGGLGVILLVGLLCGLVARPNNCVEPTVTVAPTTRTSATSAATTRTGTSSATSPTTTTSSTPRTSTSTSTTRTSTSTPRTSQGTTARTTSVSPGSITTSQGTTRSLPALTTGSTPATRPPSNSSIYRLPTSAWPNQYSLLLKFDHDPYSSIAEVNSPKFLTYTGEVTITFRANEATNQLALHMDRNVVLTDAQIIVTNLANGQTLFASGSYSDFQIFRLTLAAPLTAGNDYTMLLKFRGRTSSDGFYYHGYQERNQQARSILGTRFLPNLARTAFPCFDEPMFKSTFSIVVEHPDRSRALSNFPVQASVNFVDGTKNKIRTTFATTTPLSTYQVSWAVVPDDFGQVARPIPGVNTVVTVHGRASEINVGFGDYALDVAEQTLGFLVTYTGIQAAVPSKIDLIALPYFPDLSSSSYGLNGFREFDLFYLERENSKLDKQLTALTVAKEIAHLWFGNYLTCEFWDDVWIQEGLAQIFQYKAIENINPDWDIMNQFLVQNTVPVVYKDGYESAIALRFEVDSNYELKYLFSDIMYQKSAAIMRQFWSVFGEDNFKAGVLSLLNNRPYGTVNIDDFSNAFQVPADWGISTKEYVEPWVIQKNLPKVTLIIDNSGANTRITFIQTRFLLVNLEDETDPTAAYLWPIWLQCRAGGTPGAPLAGQTIEFTIFESRVTASATLNGKFDWIKCNKDFNGYFVTEYPDSVFVSFEDVLFTNKDAFSVADRVNLLHNAFELAWEGTHSYAITVRVAVYLESSETNLAPWKTFLYHVDRLAILLEHRESFRNLRGFAAQAIVDAIGRLDLDIYADSADHLEELLKIEFAFQLGRLQNLNALNKFSELFRSIDPVYFINPDTEPVPLTSNLRALTYKYHLQNTYDINDWFEIYTFYSVTNDEREKEYALEALANTRWTFLFDLMLDELLFGSSDKLPVEEAPLLLTAMGNNPSGRYYAWYYIREYWGDFSLRGADMRDMTEALYNIANSFDNSLLLSEINTFFLTSYDFEAGDIRQRTVEAVTNNYLWIDDREKDFMDAYFELTKK